MKKLILAAILGTTSLSVTAQVQNNGNLQIHAGGELAVFSTLTNTATGVLLNNGSLFARNNIVNAQPSMAAGTGTLFLNGTTAQALSGAEPFHTFHLSSDNSSGITLNANLTVSGTHTFVSGRIATSATPNYLVYNPGSSYTGQSDSRHVTGWVKKLGATDFTFPVGNGTYLRSSTITNLSATAEFNCVYGGATPNTTFSDLESPIRSINPHEHWIINKISGGSAQVTLNWDHPKVQFPVYIIPDVRTAQFINSKWTNTGGTATGTPSTTGSITSLPLTTFGRMAIGSISFIVPLDFIGITAQRMNNKNRVEWKTANEAGVLRYEVERSASNNLYRSIGQVAANNQRSLQSYTFEDSEPMNATVYYRVKSVDVDGALKYTKIVSVSPDQKESGIVLISNPVAGDINLMGTNLPPTIARYRVLKANGQLISQGHLTVAGTGSLLIPFRQYPAGTYILLLQYNEKEFRTQVVKQ